MSDYRLNNVTEFNELEETANYLVLFGVDKIPPHIGWVSKGRYFSKSTAGGKYDYDFLSILRSVRRKSIPTILIKLRLDSSWNLVFFNNAPLELGESCLSPIKKMMSESDPALGDVEFVFDLIEVLEVKGLISKIEHLNCEKMLQMKSLTLRKYGQIDINSAIEDTTRPC